MELLIEIPEHIKKVCEDALEFGMDGLYLPKSVVEKIANGTPLPKNATNGDMIKAIFPDAEFTRGEDGISTNFMKMNNHSGFASLYVNWYNSPYKAESEE